LTVTEESVTANTAESGKQLKNAIILFMSLKMIHKAKLLYRQ